MFEHKDVWNAIDRMAESLGLSTSGLAKKAGLDPTTFNKSKRYSPDGKERWPSTESLAKVLAATGASFSDFAEFIGHDGEMIFPTTHSASGAKAATRSYTAPKTLPMIGWAQAGYDGYFNEDGYPAGEGWDDIPFPFLYQENEADLYALEISGDSMQPLYREGDILVIAPGAQIRRGDRVVVKTHDGEVMAKELRRQTANRLDLRSLNPDFEDRYLPTGNVAWMARIFWVSQ